MKRTLRLHVGRRIIKTSVSAAAAMLISEHFGLEFPSLAVVAAIIILQPTFHETIKSAKDRMIGTLIGCVLGLLSIYVVKIDVGFDVFFGSLIILTLSSAFSFTDAGVLGMIAFVSIVTDAEADVMTVNSRIINTAIGASTSIVMNMFFPVQRIETKSLVISFKLFKLDTKLLVENLRFILGTGSFSADDFSKINDEIIKEFNAAYKFKTLMNREQKYSARNEEYELFSERYDTLWDIHSSILQIHNEKETAEIEVSEPLSVRLTELASVLDIILEQKSFVPAEVNDKLEICVCQLEEVITCDFDSVYYSEVYNEGSFFTILLTSLKRYTETIKAFTN